VRLPGVGLPVRLPGRWTGRYIGRQVGVRLPGVGLPVRLLHGARHAARLHRAKDRSQVGRLIRPTSVTYLH